MDLDDIANKPATVNVVVTNPETPFGGVQIVNADVASESDVSTVATDFLALLDTPDSYFGMAGKMVVVKSDESGLEFIDIPSGIDIPGLTSRVTSSGDIRVTTTGDIRIVI